jgi:hypothetical protein
MTPEHEAARGEQARRLLTDELLVETLDRIEQEWNDAWQNSPARDVEGREMAYLILKSAQKFRKELMLIQEQGKVAQSMLQRIGQRLRPASWE